MSKHFEAIRKYFRKGLYTKAHLEVLERKGVLTKAERRAIEKGE